MKQELTAENKVQSNLVNKVAYILFLGLVLFQLITGKFDWAIANLGIALIFDPFAPAKWSERTMTQKAVLFLHLTLLLAGVVFVYLN